MSLPYEIARRLHDVGDLVALQFRVRDAPTLFYFKIGAVERPNNLDQFSLGSASAMNTAGTTWSSIQDSSNNFILEPEYEHLMNQIYYGVGPSYIWLYRQFPSGVDRGNLRGTRSIGGQTGYISGHQSPIRYPSVETELYTVKGVYPAFLGYHPYALPASITVRMSFYISTYMITQVKRDDLSAEDMARARIITMGGSRSLIESPTWVQDKPL